MTKSMGKPGPGGKRVSLTLIAASLMMQQLPMNRSPVSRCPGANLFANVAQLGSSVDLERCLGWIAIESAKLLRLQHYGREPGCRADCIVLPAGSPAEAIRELTRHTRGYKGGRLTFTRPQARLHQSG